VAGVIAAIKQRYNLKHVYAWHAILGYWSGVSPIATPAAAAAASTAAGAAVHALPAAAVVSGEADAAAEAAAKELAAAAGITGRGKTSSGSSSGMASSVVLPRVSAAMTDLEPPCNWSQLVSKKHDNLLHCAAPQAGALCPAA
jgi:hypothetical protein